LILRSRWAYDCNGRQPGGPEDHCVRLEVGHCRHWGELVSTSVMWRIVDGGGAEQPDGSFLYQ